MKVNFVFFSVILIGIFVSGCTNLVFELNQKKSPEGTINITIHTDQENNPKINIFIDNVRVGLDELKSLMKTKKKANNKKSAAPILFGTF